MAEADREDEKGQGPQPDAGDPAPEPETASPYAERVNSQDKTKDKPDSGQNEDG